MAERVVSVVLQMLADPLIRESLLLYGVSDEVEWLQAELRWMECFLIDAEIKRRRGNKLIDNWLREVREVAHLAEDIIDTFTLQVETKKKKKRSGLLRRIKRYAAFPCDLKSRHKVGAEIEGLKAKIDHIKEGRERYGLVNLSTETSSTTPLASAADEALQARRKIHPHDSNTRVVGLSVHKKEIADRLLNPNVKRLSVVPIVGIGGLGKTTLANKIYNDNQIKAKFDAFACISVSQDFKVFEIFKELARQMMGKTMADLQSCVMVELGEMLLNFLRQKRYLIVLDDVWSKDVWDRLIREALPDVNNGSRVLLTTRLLDLAKSIDPTPYELPLLNEDDSWDLFLHKAFRLYQEESFLCPEELKEIGLSLVKRCRGLPLALEVLGGILSSKEPNSVAWTSVAERFNWSSTDDGGDCSKILGLSYDNLPNHHLKSCFLYLGVFPEDSVIKAQELIELWIAEGFIPHELEKHLAMEDTARAYLEEMADRSMIQVVEKGWLGSSASVSRFRIHDLFRDLCIREARENDFFNIYNITSNSSSTLQDTINNHGKNLRRLVVNGDISSSTSVDFMSPRNLKSILHFRTTYSASSIIIPNGLKLLRVIHFVGDGILNNDEKFPEIFAKMLTNMRHLRYLRLSGYSNNIEILPPCIHNLCNLQTLDLGLSNVSVVANWLGEIRTLRHLYLNGYRDVSCLADVGSLTNIQTLVGINASEGGWMERGLEKLVNIRTLWVCYLKEEQGRVFIDSLRKMKYLSSLVVHNFAEVAIPTEILSGLSENAHLRSLKLWGLMLVRQLPAESFHVFPPNLTKLLLGYSNLVEDPMATLEKLTYLRELKLWSKSYIGKEMVCTSGGFPRLQELWLYELKELEEWRVDDGAMPNLTFITIRRCRKLRRLPEGLQHLHSLQTLNLSSSNLEDRAQREVGDDWYKIQHVPEIRLNYKLI